MWLLALTGMYAFVSYAMHRKNFVGDLRAHSLVWCKVLATSTDGHMALF